MELFLMTIAWLLGILLGLYLKVGIVFFVVLFVFLYGMKKKNKYLKVICKKRYMLLFLICFFLSYFQIMQSEKTIEKLYQSVQEEVQIVGTIVSNPFEKEYKTVYTIQVESINGETSFKNTKLLLNVKNDKNKIVYKYGSKITLIGEFEEPTSQRNEGGFDYKQYLKTKNIYGIITAKQGQIKVENENNINVILKLANMVANKIQEKSNQLLEEKEASLLIGILIGNKENLQEDVKEAFQKSNLSHMLAVSGAHVSYVIMGIGFFITRTKISKKTGKWITMILLAFFILMTGRTPSVTRACYMSIYMIMASLLHKRVSILSSISISMLILLIGNPYCIFDVGLQLSYAGTIGIVLLYNPLKKWINKRKKENQEGIRKYLQKGKKRIQEMLCITISANIMLFPIILYHFNTLSLTFLISNLLASPIMGILVILGFLTIILSFISAPIGKILALPLKFFLNLLLQIAMFTSKFPFSQVYFATPKLIVVVLYYFVIFLSLTYKKIEEKSHQRKIEKQTLKQVKRISKKKIVASILLLMILFFFYQQIPKNLKIYFIDVGQGDSMLIITPKGKTILVDGGGTRDKESFDVGQSILMPYLFDKGITKIDYMLISHFDSDHVRRITYYFRKNASRKSNY